MTKGGIKEVTCIIGCYNIDNFRGLNNITPPVVTGKKNSPTVAHAYRKRRIKWVLGVWGYNWATQSAGDIIMETWFSTLGAGRGAGDSTPEKVNS
jgi:hypothetical protein